MVSYGVDDFALGCVLTLGAATSLSGENWGYAISRSTCLNAIAFMQEKIGDVAEETTNWIEKLNRELLTYARTV
jgi:hypothetical protein